MAFMNTYADIVGKQAALRLVVMVAGLALISGCAYKTATPAERVGITAALQAYETNGLGGVLVNLDKAEMKVRDNKAKAQIVVTYPGGQVFAARKHASLYKKEGGWVVENVWPKEIWK